MLGRPGGGPGGYVADSRAAQFGRRVALVEKAELRGICLNWGCIPSKVLDLFHRANEFGIAAQGVQADLAKAVLRSRKVVDRMVKGVAFLMRKNKIDVFRGEGVLRSPTELEVRPAGQVLTTKNVILATGARPRDLPNLLIDGGRTVIGSTEALQLGRTLEATPSELGFAVHPHPTLSEVLKEAALAVRGEAIHI